MGSQEGSGVTAERQYGHLDFSLRLSLIPGFVKDCLGDHDQDTVILSQPQVNLLS